MEANKRELDVILMDIVQWTIPTFGNRHIMPYGKLKVYDKKTGEIKIVKTKGDLATDNPYTQQHIFFNRRKYNVVNSGSYWFPKLKLAYPD